MTPPGSSDDVGIEPRIKPRVRRVIAREFAWVSGGRIVAAVLQAVSLVVVARLLPVFEFGYLATFLGVTTLVQVALDFGVGSLVTRERAADETNPVVAAALRFTNVSTIALIVLLLLGLAAGAVYVSDVYWQMLPLAVWAAAERNADTRLSVAFADGDVQINVVNLLSRRTAASTLR